MAYWFLKRDAFTDTGKWARFMFKGAEPWFQQPTALSAEEALEMLPSQFRVFNTEGSLVIEGFADSASRDPLEWAKRTAPDAAEIRYKAKGENAWVPL